MRRRSVTSSIWATKCSGVPSASRISERLMRAIARRAARGEEAALDREALRAPGDHRLDRHAVDAAVGGMQQVVERPAGELGLRPSGEVAQRAVRAQQRPVRGDERQPHGGALEGAGEALLGLAQRVPGAHAVGDVADDRVR